METSTAFWGSQKGVRPKWAEATVACLCPKYKRRAAQPGVGIPEGLRADIPTSHEAVV